MPVYQLTPKPAVAEAVQAGLPVVDRLIEVATAAGYVIGPGGVQAYPDGRVVIDCDRDPSADWATFDPEIPTAQEEADAALQQEIVAALGDLDTGAALLLGEQPVSPETMRYILGRLCAMQAGTIRVLVQRGVVGAIEL